jgi:hypothetical protein
MFIVGNRFENVNADLGSWMLRGNKIKSINTRKQCHVLLLRWMILLFRKLAARSSYLRQLNEKLHVTYTPS